MVGVWLAGGVYVPVNVRHPDAEVEAVLAGDRAAVILDRWQGVHGSTTPSL